MWPCYCTDYVYVLIHFCESVNSFWVEVNLWSLLLAHLVSSFVFICHDHHYFIVIFLSDTTGPIGTIYGRNVHWFSKILCFLLLLIRGMQKKNKRPKIHWYLPIKIVLSVFINLSELFWSKMSCIGLSICGELYTFSTSSSEPLYAQPLTYLVLAMPYGT
jgi:hypothetical protein